MLRLSPKVLQAYNHSSRICFLRFFENPKKRDFLRFFEAAFQKKRKKRNPKCEVSDFADFSLHGISTTALKQCMFIMALVLAKRTTNLIECGI